MTRRKQLASCYALQHWDIASQESRLLRLGFEMRALRPSQLMPTRTTGTAGQNNLYGGSHPRSLAAVTGWQVIVILNKLLKLERINAALAS